MELKKLSTPSLTELFVKELESKIISGELKIGEKLPSERELAEQMQVSRAVVNAGIAEMQQKGFLVIRPRVGTFVEDYRKNGTLETFVSTMKYHEGLISKNEVNSILQLRVVLVTLAAELAVADATDEQLKGLEEIVSQLSSKMPDEEIVELTFKLHHELAFISGNNLLPLLFASFKYLVCKLWHRYIMNNGKAALIESDRLLVKYLVDRDVDAAKAHIRDNTNLAIKDERMYM